MGITEKEALAIQFFRNATREARVSEDGTLEMARRLADEFTAKYGISASVIRKNNKYFWVTDYYFDTYPYNGKIYYKTEVTDKN